MEVTQRKSNSGKSYSSSSGPKYDIDSDPKRSNVSSLNSSAEPEFKYGILLGSVLLIPIVIIFAFGGRPSLIALCFGALIAYIFDLIGAVEVFIGF